MCIGMIEVRYHDTTEVTDQKFGAEPALNAAIEEMKADPRISKITIFRPTKVLTKKIVWDGE